MGGAGGGGGGGDERRKVIQKTGDGEMTSNGTAKWVPARRAAQSPLRVGSKRFCRMISSLHPEKTGEKKIYNTNRTFRPHGLPKQNREQSGRKGVTYRYRDNETSVLYVSWAAYFRGVLPWLQKKKKRHRCQLFQVRYR